MACWLYLIDRRKIVTVSMFEMYERTEDGRYKVMQAMAVPLGSSEPDALPEGWSKVSHRNAGVDLYKWDTGKTLGGTDER